MRRSFQVSFDTKTFQLKCPSGFKVAKNFSIKMIIFFIQKNTSKDGASNCLDILHFVKSYVCILRLINGIGFMSCEVQTIEIFMVNNSAGKSR